MSVPKPENTKDKVDVVTAAIVGKVSPDASKGTLEKAVKHLISETKKLNLINTQLLEEVRNLNKKDQSTPAPQAENQSQRRRP
ncbi:MAG TPA: hypothetical protein VLI69_08880 [Gammaproteobacteria bacterium]|nr:hypothetical protein [Gammaproteobacteria bacterium]